MTSSIDNPTLQWIRCNYIAGISITSEVFGLTHILGLGRLICHRSLVEILYREFEQATSADEIASRTGFSIESTLKAIHHFHSVQLIKPVELNEVAVINCRLDISFAEPCNGKIQKVQTINHRYADLSAGFGGIENDATPSIRINDALHLNPAITIMPLSGGSGGIVTHFLEGPLLLDECLWGLAMAFKKQCGVSQAVQLAGLGQENSERILQAVSFLLNNHVLCKSGQDEIARIYALTHAEVDSVLERFRENGDVTPATYQDPHFKWFQPYGRYTLDCVRETNSTANVAILGNCQTHFIAGTLRYLAQQTGLHLDIDGWNQVGPQLSNKSYALVIIPTAVEVASFYEALAVKDLNACASYIPDIISQVNHTVCQIRRYSDSPILIIAPGSPTLTGFPDSGHELIELNQIIAKLNRRLLDSVALLEEVSMLSEQSAIQGYGDSIILDDEYNASPHHCSFDIWAWRDEPMAAEEHELPERSSSQIHPAYPLARACLTHLQRLYISPKVRLVVVEPNGMLWPGRIDDRETPFPAGFNVYTGLNYFAWAGINEALCHLYARGIRLACLSSTETTLLRQRFRMDSSVRNLVRPELLISLLGGTDKKALLQKILRDTGIDEEEILLVDPDFSPGPDFRGRYYAGNIWGLRRYLLTAPELWAQEKKIVPEQTNNRPTKYNVTRQPANEQEINDTLDLVLTEQLHCNVDALRGTDDLRLLGLDSMGCLALVLALQERLDFRLPDHEFVATVMFYRSSLCRAIHRAIASLLSDAGSKQVDSSRNWFDQFDRDSWCDQDIASVIQQHVKQPHTGWIFKFVQSGRAFDYHYVGWQELYQAALGYTRLYNEVGLHPGDVVTLLLDQGLSLVAAELGAILGGFIPSINAFPNDKQVPEAFLKWFGTVVSTSKTRCIICFKELSMLIELELHVKNLRIPVIHDIPEPVSDEPVEHVSPDSPAILQHSSGTTGLKKGVFLTHKHILAQIWDLSHALDNKDQDVIVSWLPYYHDMGLIACLMLPLLRAIPTVVMSPFDWVKQPHILLREISMERGTLCWLPNFAYYHCARRVQNHFLNGLDLGSLRAVINCSEPVTADAMSSFFQRFSSIGLNYSALTASYAMAENTFAVSQSSIGKPARIIEISKRRFMLESVALPVTTTHDSNDVMRLVSSGSILPYSKVQIMDDCGKFLNEGFVGEICLNGDYRFDGYVNDNEVNKQPFQGGWYYTGDLGFFYENELYVTGRKKDLIIISGHNVYPHDIEQEAGMIPGIKSGRVVAFGVFDEEAGTEQLIILAESEGSTGEDIECLKQKVRELILAEFFVNVADFQLHLPGSLHKSTSGKLARNANREKYLKDDNYKLDEI